MRIVNLNLAAVGYLYHVLLCGEIRVAVGLMDSIERPKLFCAPRIARPAGMCSTVSSARWESTRSGI